jgi:colicin import membrane protein
VKELDKRGMPVRDIAAPMTEAERKKQEDEDKRRLDAQTKEEDRARQDQALMARYKSEGDIAAARKKDLIQIDQRIADSDAAVAQAEKQLQAAQNETRQATGGSAAEAVQKRVKDAQLVIDEQKKLAEASRKEKAQINARYTDTLTKFRAINAASNQQPATPSK